LSRQRQARRQPRDEPLQERFGPAAVLFEQPQRALGPSFLERRNDPVVFGKNVVRQRPLTAV